MSSDEKDLEPVATPKLFWYISWWTRIVNFFNFKERFRKSNLVSHAEKELRRAGMFDKGSDYNGALGKSILDMVKVFSTQGHSGFSASLTIDILNKLLKYKTLTPISSNPDEWMDITDMCGKNAKTLWQNKRDPSFFSKDGGKTWYNIDDPSLNKTGDELLKE